MAKQLKNNYKRENHKTYFQNEIEPKNEKFYVIPVDTSVKTLLQQNNQNFQPFYTGENITETLDHMKIKAQREILQERINFLASDKLNMEKKLQEINFNQKVEERINEITNQKTE